ncbi:MAG TPA: hydroxyacid dehydrogenase [Lacunisphaera sp.]|nr:hydroxyacid dehydrogenase [Lacunisphaera sp.]
MSLPRSLPLSPVLASPTLAMVALPLRERRLFFPPSVEAKGLSALSQPVWPPDAELTPEAWPGLLRRSRPEILLTGWSTPPLPTEWLDAPDCPLRYVCHLTGSVRKVVPRSFIEKGGLVTNWGAFAGKFAAEHALLLALASLRNLNAWRPFLAQPVGQREPESIGTRSLHGRRVGLHGFGSIGRALLPLLRPFGVSIQVFSAGVPDSFIRAEGAESCATIEELFRRSEVLFECEALTAATAGTVNAALLRALPDGAVFVNIGRGRVVDEPALVREAAVGRIQVAVDVTTEEMTAQSALAQLPSAIISPHIAGPSHDQYARCGELALQNVERFLRGDPPVARVTLEIYDRST